MKFNLKFALCRLIVLNNVEFGSSLAFAVDNLRQNGFNITFLGKYSF